MLDLLGDRWTLLIVRDLFWGRSRFSEFLDAPEGIPTNLLADRLKRLEAAHLVTTEVYQERPRRWAYRLTAKGEALRPLMQALVDWGREHVTGTRVLAEFTGDAADAPFLPRGVKLPARSARAPA
ncbi:MAG TPA: helix-turn-helix domain-containing protein [Candidatus Synoicihabitans sp.]|nr:helix-turn-helix domain-containing protein [Candidatus Synoicihabitans sp.]